MSPQQKEFHNLRVHAGRANVEQTAWLLGVNAHDVPIIVAAKIGLSPLGRPGPTSPKYFSTAELMELRQDRRFLDRMTTALHEHWRKKRSNRSGGPSFGEAA